MKSGRALIYMLSSGKIILLFFALNLYLFSQFLFTGNDFQMDTNSKQGGYQDGLAIGDHHSEELKVINEQESRQAQHLPSLKAGDNVREKVKAVNNRSRDQQLIHTPQKSILGAHLLELLAYPQPEYIEKARSPCFFTDSKQKVGSLRCFPTIFLAGFAKSGTSDLHAAISFHQHVVSGFFKEPQFWHNLRPAVATDDGIYLGGNKLLDSYLENFKCLSTVVEENFVSHTQTKGIEYDKRKLTPGRIQFPCKKTELQQIINNVTTKSGLQCPLLGIDSSPMYLYEGFLWESDPANTGQKREPKILTPHRIKHFIASPKIIVLMRNPIERLFSDFKFFTQGKNSSDYFDTLISNGIAWWNQCVTSLPVYRCAFGRDFSGTNVTSLGNDGGTFDWGDSEAMKHNGANRLRYSIYVIYIKKWLEVFPPSSFLFIKTEEYANDPLGILTNQILPFLELELMSQNSLKNYGIFQKKGPKNANKKVKMNMLPHTRSKLEAFFTPYNEELCKLIRSDKFMWLD